MPHRAAEMTPGEPAAQKRRSPRTKHLRPGNRNLARIRKAPLLERASIALGGIFGTEVREAAYCVVEGIKRGTMSASIGKLILERVLPASRPVQLDLPEMTGPTALIEADGKILAAVNAGKISPQEARTLQAMMKTLYRNRRVANAEMGVR